MNIRKIRDIVKNLLLIIYKDITVQIKDPIFAIAFALAIFSWFLNNLMGDFTTVISIPIKIEGVIVDSKDNVSKSQTNNIFQIDCKVSGKGYRILYYSMLSRIEINATEVKIDKSPNGEYVVDIPSLENELNQKFSDVTLINIFQNRLAFNALTHINKVIPVTLDIDIVDDDQYMQIGDAIIEPSHIEASGDILKINSLNEILTNHINIENRRETVSGEIDLKNIPGVLLNNSKVYYSFTFQRYTEIKVEKNVEVVNAKKGIYKVIPSCVEVAYLVAESSYEGFNPDLYPIKINIKDSSIGDNKYLIESDSLPRGVKIRMIYPQYVTALKDINRLNR